MGVELSRVERARGQYAVIVLAWLMGAALLEAFVLVLIVVRADVLDWPKGFLLAFEAMTEVPFLRWMYLVALVVTSPLLVLAWRGVWRLTPLDVAPDDLGGLSPGLRGLVGGARALRVALEHPDDDTLRAVWDWQRSFEQLGEAERRELEHLGLGDVDVAAPLGSIVAPAFQRMTLVEIAHFERRIREIVGTLEAFEQRLLAANSVFRGPFR